MAKSSKPFYLCWSKTFTKKKIIILFCNSPFFCYEIYSNSRSVCRRNPATILSLMDGRQVSRWSIAILNGLFLKVSTSILNSTYKITSTKIWSFSISPSNRTNLSSISPPKGYSKSRFFLPNTFSRFVASTKKDGSLCLWAISSRANYFETVMNLFVI